MAARRHLHGSAGRGPKLYGAHDNGQFVPCASRDYDLSVTKRPKLWRGVNHIDRVFVISHTVLWYVYSMA
jgi:hypothetical protein